MQILSAEGCFWHFLPLEQRVLTWCFESLHSYSSLPTFGNIKSIIVLNHLLVFFCRKDVVRHRQIGDGWTYQKNESYYQPNQGFSSSKKECYDRGRSTPSDEDEHTNSNLVFKRKRRESLPPLNNPTRMVELHIRRSSLSKRLKAPRGRAYGMLISTLSLTAKPPFLFPKTKSGYLFKVKTFSVATPWSYSVKHLPWLAWLTTKLKIAKRLKHKGPRRCWSCA